MMHRLTNATRYYDWGSTTAIPEFLGLEPDGRPVAEVWLGAHASAPSTIAGRSLAEAISADPDAMLGPRVLALFGPRLPYLFKLLAASRPLSLQVHPNLEQARMGFAAEEAAGLPRSSPERSFPDDQHKPEMLYALTRFEGLSGFRSANRILEIIEPLEGALIDQIRVHLSVDRTSTGIKQAFEAVLHARDTATAADIAETVKGCEAQLLSGFGSQQAYGTAVALAHWYPGDPGAIASLLLNRFTLQSGESMVVEAGVVHAYLAGFGLETMASSDNVLRAGLTHKKVDIDALLRCTNYGSARPMRPQLVPGPNNQPAMIRPPVKEFALAVIEPGRGPAGRVQYATQDGPRTLLCISGTMAVRSADGSEMAITQGDSVFVPHSSGRLEFRGEGRVILVCVP